MFTRVKLLGSLTGAIVLACGPFAEMVNAALVGVPILAEAASLAAYKVCRDDGRGILFCGGLALTVDPADQLLRFQLSIDYDPLRLSVNLAGSGFLCDFSASTTAGGGDCPPLGVNGSIDGTAPLRVGGPRLGTSYELSDSISPGVFPLRRRISLDYDMSANPATESAERNVFAIPFETLFEFSGQVIPFYEIGLHDVSIASVHCVTIQSAGCATSAPIVVALDFVQQVVIPEPRSTTLVLVGLTGIVGCRWLSKRRSSYARSLYNC